MKKVDEKTTINGSTIKRIHVNQHVIKANAKSGDRNPCLTVKCGNGDNLYGNEITVEGTINFIYKPDEPLSCGAKVWAETQGKITVT